MQLDKNVNDGKIIKLKEGGERVSFFYFMYLLAGE